MPSLRWPSALGPNADSTLPFTGQTNLPKVFTGGDCANGGREVVNAVGEGKKAAHAIHTFLTRERATPTVQPSRLGAKNGNSGSGLMAPIRAPELEEEMGVNGGAVPVAKEHKPARVS